MELNIHSPEELDAYVGQLKYMYPDPTTIPRDLWNTLMSEYEKYTYKDDSKPLGVQVMDGVTLTINSDMITFAVNNCQTSALADREPLHPNRVRELVENYLFRVCVGDNIIDSLDTGLTVDTMLETVLI